MLYRKGKDNICPGCGKQHWKVGRQMAECAFCTTALPIAAQDHALFSTPAPKKPLIGVLWDNLIGVTGRCCQTPAQLGADVRR